MQITAAVVGAMGADFELRSIEIDEPRADEVLVRIAAVGLCHTDLVCKDHGESFAFPIVFGHEGAGIVERVGSAVTKVQAGDRVVLTFRSCGKCRKCRQHHPAYCETMPALNYAGARTDGSTALSDDGRPVASNFFGQSSFASFAIAYESNVVQVPAHIPFATLAPLGCGVQTGAGAVMRSFACPPGSSIVIIGGGTVGLSAVLGAVLQGCAAIIVVEPRAERRTLALDLGATDVVDPAAESVVQAVRRILPAGADYIVDATGIPEVIAAAFEYLGADGTLGLVGVPHDPAAMLPLPLGRTLMLGHRVMGIIEGDSDPDTFIPELLEHHAAGRFPYDRLIATYPMADISRAVLDQRDGVCVKPVLIVDAALS